MRDRYRWAALVVLCTGMLMIVLDMTIVSVALPSIQGRLGFSQAGLAWVVNAYLIAFAGLPSGLVNTTAQIGGALGLAVLATVSASRSNSLIAQHHPAAAALTEGYHLAFWIACGLVVVAAVIAAAVLRPQPSLPPAAQPPPELVIIGQAG